MPHLSDISSRQLATGLTGKYVHGDALTFGLIEIEAGSNLPEHSHVHEQITYVLEGELDMKIGGEQCRLSAGMFYVIPSNILHSAIAITACKLIDVFNPVREDYR